MNAPLLRAEFRWVAALPAEAKAIRKAFDLHPIQGEGPKTLFPAFSNSDGNIRLVQSGVGKVKSAAAVAWLHAQEKSPQGARFWVNFGIAGRGDARLGDVYQAGRVTDLATGRAWYPQTIWPKKYDLPVAELYSLDEPSEDYDSRSQVLLEMEASGFLTIAQSCAGVEFAHVFKVVSDNREQSWKKIDAAHVERLCEESLPRLFPILEQVDAILSTESKVGQTEESLFAEFTKKWHFSSSSRVQLRRLLQQWTAVGRETSELRKVLHGDNSSFGTGKEVIQNLKNQIWKP